MMNCVAFAVAVASCCCCMCCCCSLFLRRELAGPREPAGHKYPSRTYPCLLSMDRRIPFYFIESVCPSSSVPSSGKELADGLTMNRRILFYFIESVCPSSADPSLRKGVSGRIDDGQTNSVLFHRICLAVKFRSEPATPSPSRTNH